MKIVFLSFYSGWIFRGMETFVHELAKRLAERHKITVIQAGPRPKYSLQQKYEVQSLAQKLRWPEIDSEGWSRKLMLDYYYRQIFIFTLKACWNNLTKLKPDIVIPVNGGWQSFLVKLYCLWHKSPLVLIGQAGLGWDDRWNLLMRPDLFVALSQRNFFWTKSHAQAGQEIVVIPNGVDLRRFTPKGEKMGLELTPPIILCVAGGERYKRVEETIRAVARLKRGSLLLVSQSANYDFLGKKVLGKRFLRIFVEPQQMPKVYRSADLFTLASDSSEAFGISYLEAMASGLPIVATDDELRHEIIGKAGIFIKRPQESQRYAEKLKIALNKNWENIPRKQAEKFSWDKIGQRYEKVLNNLYEKNH